MIITYDLTGTRYDEKYSIRVSIFTLSGNKLGANTFTGDVGSNITGGNINSDGGAAITARGVCWGTSSNQTVADAKTVNGSGLGSFVGVLTGLQANTTYFVRAYAINAVDTSYGAEVNFITPDGIPILTTAQVTNITTNSATGGGTIITDGGAAVTVSGVCWSTSPVPDISDATTTDGTISGSFTSTMTGLQSNTTYYVRAYAVTAFGTGYGNVQSFSTE